MLPARVRSGGGGRSAWVLGPDSSAPPSTVDPATPTTKPRVSDLGARFETRTPPSFYSLIAQPFFKMALSLLSIKNRDPGSLLYSVRNVRVSKFSTPSSFYIQLLDEDESYNNLQVEMQEYYNGVTVYSYCCNLTGAASGNSSLNKLKIQQLRVSIFVLN